MWLLMWLGLCIPSCYSFSVCPILFILVFFIPLYRFIFLWVFFLCKNSFSSLLCKFSGDKFSQLLFVLKSISSTFQRDVFAGYWILACWEFPGCVQGWWYTRRALRTGHLVMIYYFMAKGYEVKLAKGKGTCVKSRGNKAQTSKSFLRVNHTGHV